MDAYLRGVAPKWRGLLTEMRRTIREAAPEAREGISYRIPTFFHHGNLVHFAAFEGHASFFPGSGRAREKFPRELRSFPGTKGSIHLTPEHPLPSALVKRIVRWRVRENEGR
ncbi:MAG: DUF1801 domain-containing protein [Euryarchaeota archaeon]|nr:DUF1801 domain-containing protein [Euryarchaeota archaeon]MDE1835014.1 DUF1801 domain-containing protein [Euryarchaeota archaeon]MDE1881335.1 DUF1801 domain-containing protein [Euryarchaeota archaeon]MDE2044853.1 DUF1801 domain-containing protein [Thermoplasmata archaeon]